MAEFTYLGTDKSGAPVEGSMEAENAHDVARARKAEGELLYSVTRVDTGGYFSGSRPLRVEDLNMLTEQLASLTSSGVPLAPALGELAREMQGSRVGRIIERVQSDVSGGTSLEEALGNQGESIPPLYRSLVRVGERTGNLPEVLRQLTQLGQRYLWFRYRLQVTMAYPCVLLVLLVFFLGGFVPHVIGQFGDIYSTYGRELPLITYWALAAGRGMLYMGAPLLFLLFAVLLVSRFLVQSVRFRARWDRFSLALPLFGPVYQSVLSARFFRALSLLLEHGAPIGESLHLAGMATSSLAFSQAAHQVALDVSGGECVSDALERTGLFKRTHSWILQQGERNGNFTETLSRLADACDREAERLEERSLSRLGPGMIIVCGICVGFFVVACFIPIFQFPAFIGT